MIATTITVTIAKIIIIIIIKQSSILPIATLNLPSSIPPPFNPLFHLLQPFLNAHLQTVHRHLVDELDLAHLTCRYIYR